MDKELKGKITESFRSIGIDAESVAVYLELWTRGPSTVVQLSRQLGMGRNKIYKIIEELKKYSLVNQIKKNYGSIYEALHYKNLKSIINSKEATLKKAKNSMEYLFDTLPGLTKGSAISSKVIHYYGIDGLKQVNWNLVDTDGTLRVYEVSRLSSYLEKDFAEDIRAQLLKKKVLTKDITNDTEIEAHTRLTEFTRKYSQYRHIDPSVLKIATETYIYNDIVTVLQYDTLKYDPKSVFCVEIHNKALANFQKQIFDILWEQCKKFKVLDDFGTRSLT
jgi:sugar-specific transcriptional regulator TrmB